MNHDARAMRVLLERAFREALTAVDVEARVRRAVPRLVPRSSAVRIVAVGKAAPAMARGAMAALGDRVVAALVIAPDGTPLGALDSRAEIVRAAHPLPDERSVFAAARALAMARAAGRARGDVFLALVSGGASSLLCAPYRATLARKVEVVRSLLHANATIAEINVVRRHASRVKGGALLHAARPARVISLLVSDVIGGAPYDIGSGPTLTDPTQRAHARDVLTRYAISSLPLRESVAPSSADARRAVHRVVASPSDLAAALRSTLARAGLWASVLPSRTADIAWFASSYASLAHRLGRGEAIVRAAEPTIQIDVARPGRGGRASHLAAVVAASLPRDVLFFAAASDGVDGNSGAAGAIVDCTSFADLAPREVSRKIARFDTASLHEATGTAIAGSPSGHNLADVHVLVRL